MHMPHGCWLVYPFPRYVGPVRTRCSHVGYRCTAYARDGALADSPFVPVATVVLIRWLLLRLGYVTLRCVDLIVRLSPSPRLHG